MKTKVLVSVALALTLTTASYAQGFHLGLKAGANVVKIDGKAFSEEYKFGYNVGAFAEIFFTPSFGIQPELNWNQSNYRTGNQAGDVIPGGTNNFSGKLNYLSIPLLLTYRPVKPLSLQLGPQFGVLVSQDQPFKDVGGNVGNAFKKGDFSMVGGAQLNLANVKLGARYAIGLNNLNDINHSEDWKSQGFQFYVGFRLF